jgi:hypothetical protein
MATFLMLIVKFLVMTNMELYGRRGCAVHGSGATTSMGTERFTTPVAWGVEWEGVQRTRTGIPAEVTSFPLRLKSELKHE